MFAKLSALALCVSLVSALTVTVDADVKVGADVAVSLDAAVGDVTLVDVHLRGPDNVDIKLLADVQLDVDVDVKVDLLIPDTVVAADAYVFVAVDSTNPGTVCGQSDPFAIGA